MCLALHVPLNSLDCLDLFCVRFFPLYLYQVRICDANVLTLWKLKIKNTSNFAVFLHWRYRLSEDLYRAILQSTMQCKLENGIFFVNNLHLVFFVSLCVLETCVLWVAHRVLWPNLTGTKSTPIKSNKTLFSGGF